MVGVIMVLNTKRMGRFVVFLISGRISRAPQGKFASIATT
jgi:hypothetical protein